MDWPILTKEVDFTKELLPTAEGGAFSIDALNTLMFVGDGLTLVPTVLEGTVHVPFSASLCNALIRASVLYDIPTDSLATVSFRVQYGGLYWTWIGGAWVSSANATTWGDITVLRNMPSWTPKTAFQLDIRLARPSVSEAAPVLSWFGLLYTVLVQQWDAYVQTVLSSYLSSVRYTGRLGITATTHLSGADNVLTLGADVVLDPSYLTPVVTAVLYNNGDILSSVSGDTIILTEALVDASVIVLYEYSLKPTVVNQSLDYVEIETFPMLVVSNMDYRTDNPGAYVLEFKDEDAGNCLTAEWPVCTVISFTLAALATLYWDSLSLWSKFAGYTSASVDIPGTGKSMLLEVTDRVKDTTFPGGTSGTRVFSNGFKLTYPSPIPILKTEMLVTKGISLTTGRLGG